MSNEKISDLPAAGSALSSDLYCIVQGGVTKKLVESQLVFLLQSQLSFTNIYNTDGSLTANRNVNLNGNTLIISGPGPSYLQLSSSGVFELISVASITLQAPLLDFGLLANQLNINPANINFTAAPFIGGGTQYLTVDNLGKLGVDGGSGSINIYNADGTLTSSRTLNTDNFPLLFMGNGSLTLDTPDIFAAVTGANALTVGSNTYQGIATGGSQINKGKFNVVINDDNGIYSNSFIRFSEDLPVTMVLGKSRGTESAPAPIEDGDLIGVFAFGAHDGGTFSGLNNFNLASGMFCIAAPGQAVGNTPGSLLFNVNLMGNEIGSTLLSFNAGGNAEILLGQNVTSTFLDSVVIGKDIAANTIGEVALGNTNARMRLEGTGVMRFFAGSDCNYNVVGNINMSSNNIINIVTPTYQLNCTTGIAINSNNINLTASSFVGGGTQYLTVDNTGKIVPTSSGVSTNIYNSNGSLTADRTVNFNGNFLEFSGASSDFNVYTDNINLGSTTANVLTIRASTFINQSGFIGGGNQYIGVNNSGQLITLSSGGDTNIYNSSGTLTGNRVVNLGTSSLNFAGGAGNMLSFNGDHVNLTVGAGQFNVNSSVIEFNVFTGGGSTQYLYVNNSGRVLATTVPPSTNIYNSDGSLTADRIVDLNSFNLQFSSVGTEQITFDTDMTFSKFAGGGATQYLYVNNVGLLATTSTLPISNIYTVDGTLTGARSILLNNHNIEFSAAGTEQFILDTDVTFSKFVGSGPVQYLYVDNAGLTHATTIVPSNNIYNTSGSLTADRIVALNTFDLTFTGFPGSLFTISSQDFKLDSTSIIFDKFAGGGATQYLYVDNTGALLSTPTLPPNNIYNTDGALTGTRIVNLNSQNIIFFGGGTEEFILDSSVTFNKFNGGGAIQYLYVDNTGIVHASTAGSTLNIYNTDGSLTTNRTLDLNGHQLNLGTAYTTAKILIDPVGNIRIGTGTSIEIDSLALNLGSTSHSLNIFNGTIKLWASQFVGGGTQYLTVDNGGFITPTTGTAAINIYNTDGTLTGNRVITFNSDSISFDGNGTFTIGQTLTAAGDWVFVQGSNNSVSSDRSTILGGQHNDVNGLVSGIFTSDQCTINAQGSSLGYGTIIASYNSIGVDNFTASIATYNGINNGIRSLLLGGQNNKIHAPSTGADCTDCIIITGDTNSILPNVQNSTIFQSLSCIIGDATNLVSSAYVLNSSSCTLTERNYMVDINGLGNNLSAQNAIVLNGHNCTLTATPGSTLDGRYFLANANGCTLGVGGGFYASLISCVNTELNGSYCTAISCDTAQFSNVADHSVILGGNGHNMQGVNSAIMLGVGNTIGNVTNCGAIGSDINITHANCIMINDGANPLVSSNNNTVVISAGNGVGVGKGVEHPLQDVLLGRKLSVLTLNLAVDFATDTQQAIGYYVDTSAGNRTMTLANADKIGGTLFFVQKINAANDLIFLPASGNINGLPSYTISAGATKGVTVGSDGTNWFTFGT